MTWREAIKRLEDFSYEKRDHSLSRLQSLIEILQIVATVEPTADVDAQHDILYFGPEVDDEDQACPYSEKQIDRLAALGVHHDDETRSLAYFT